jgi:4-hydroxy-tetrahydrodipicolinate synthase
MDNQCKGIIVPLITPLKENGALDYEGLERLIDYVIEGGVDGVFILGTAGEGPCMGGQDQEALIRQSARYVRNRVRLLVGATNTAPAETVRITQAAADVGAYAVVIAPPPYFQFSQDELISYARFVAGASALPVLLYNIPKMTKTNYEPETIRSLMDNRKIIGMKDSSGNIDSFRETVRLTRERPDWSMLIGYEHLLAEAMNAGGNGGVLAGANVFPGTLAGYYKAVKEGNKNEEERIGRLLSERREIYSLGTGVTSSIQAIKCVLEIKGICGSRMSVPFGALSDSSRNKVRELMKRY